jgi:hypothetical protein
VSSVWRSVRPILVVAVLLAVTGGALGCGGDEEATQAAAEPPATESMPTTDSTVAPTTPSTNTPEEPARRKQRRVERKPQRPRREKPPSATETDPEPPSETKPESVPAPPEPEPKPEPERTTPEKTKPPEPEETVLFIEENATLKLVRREGVTYWQEGTVEGTLAGTIAVKTTIGGPGVISTFTVTFREGTVRGRARARVRPDGSVVHYKGTASITGGTGTYAGARGRNLRYSGSGAPDGSTATARLTGKVRY